MLRRLLATALLVLLLAACGGENAADQQVVLDEGVTETAATPTEPPAPEPATEAPDAPATEPAPDVEPSEAPAPPPVDPPAPSEEAPSTETQTFELSLNGDGTEGGCTWGVDEDEFFYDIVYPEGYEIVGSPVSLVGPDGEVIASEGTGMRVTGRLAPDRTPSCETGTVLIAESVERL